MRSAARCAVLSGGCPAAPASLAWTIGPCGAGLTVRPRLMVLRAASTNRLGARLSRTAATKQRRGRSDRLRTRFTCFAVTPLEVARGAASPEHDADQTPLRRRHVR